MKNIISLLTVGLMISCLTACSAESTSETTVSLEAAETPVPARIQFETEHNGQSLKIDAAVNSAGQVPSEKIELVYDADAEKALYDVLVDDPSLLGYSDSEGRLAGISFNPEFVLGTLKFVDHRKTDWHEQEIDPNADPWHPYITSIKPGNMQKSGAEAADALSDFLETYSCLEYLPFSVNAREGADGAYNIIMLPVFEGAHILSRDMHMANAQVRESGLEDFQGTLLLKEAQRLPLENPISFQQILDQFKSEYHQYTFAKTVNIRRVEACYVAVPNKNSWTLHPAWAFLGDTSDGFVEPYSEYHSSSHSLIGYVYDMEDGFLDVLDGNQLLEFF